MTRTTRGAVLRRLALVSLVAVSAGCAGMNRGGTAEGVKLYDRLGGYNALAAVTDDFLGRILSDTAIVPFFKGLEDRDKVRIRQLLVDQLCEATGGPCRYIGRTMQVVHAEMQVNDRVWNAFAGHLVATLDQLKVPAHEKQELLEIIGSMKKDIVK